MIWISSCFAEYMYIINHIKSWPSRCCFAHSLRLPCHVCALSWERVVGAMDSTGSSCSDTRKNETRNVLLSNSFIYIYNYIYIYIITHILYIYVYTHHWGWFNSHVLRWQMLFLPRSFFDASHFTWHRGWQKSHFGDFEHQFHVFVGYYIPNSWVMREMRAFTNPFFIVFLSIHDLQHNVPYFSSNLPGTHLLDRGMVETTKKIISIANTGFVLLRFVTMGVGVASVDISP